MNEWITPRDVGISPGGNNGKPDGFPHYQSPLVPTLPTHTEDGYNRYFLNFEEE